MSKEQLYYLSTLREDEFFRFPDDDENVYYRFLGYYQSADLQYRYYFVRNSQVRWTSLDLKVFRLHPDSLIDEKKEGCSCGWS